MRTFSLSAEAYTLQMDSDYVYDKIFCATLSFHVTTVYIERFF